MSLGWQTESAILPGKVRPIKVGDKSILSLKALVYEKEQKQKLSKSETNSSVLPKKNGAKLTDTLANKNESKAKRQARDEEEEAELKAQAALAAKAKLYEDIMTGKVRASSSVIDFRSKQKQEDKFAPSSSSSANSQAVNGGAKGSHPPPPPPPPPMPPSLAASSTLFSNPPHSAASVSAASAEREEELCGGDAEQVAAAWREEQRQERLLQAEVEKRVSSELESRGQRQSQGKDSADGDRDSNRRQEKEHGVASGGRVVSQWERTLQSSARPFLDQIHREAQRARTLAAEQRSEAGARVGQEAEEVAGEQPQLPQHEEQEALQDLLQQQAQERPRTWREEKDELLKRRRLG